MSKIRKIAVLSIISIPIIYLSAITTVAQGISDFVEGDTIGIDILGDTGGINDEFLETKFGVSPEALDTLSKFFDINIEKGRFRTRNLEEILASLENEDECPSVLHIVPGICPDGVDGLELPKAVEIEDDAEVRGSGGLRRNSEPQQDFFTSNTTVFERDLANLFDQQSSRAFAFDYLDKTGEKWLLANTLENQALLEGSEIIQSDVLQLAKDAQELQVTQDVMKNMTGIDQLRSQIDINNGRLLGRINTSLLNIQQQNASQMQLSANVSEAFDEANRARRNERDISAVESFRSTVFIPGLTETQESNTF